MTAPELAATQLRSPGRSAGLVEVLRWRFLLKLLVNKELRVRYRGSVLGMVWSYVKPAVQLCVYWLAMGHFIGVGREIPNYVIYLFSGMVMINFFNEIVINATRSIIFNAPLVGKIYMPRELFPVSSLWVALVHLVPQLVVLLIGCLLLGWRPGPANIAALLAAIGLVATFGLGVGLVFATFNVFYRDAENLIELFNMVAIWLSPVFYTWAMVERVLPDGPFLVYQWNPLTAAVELAHQGFWLPTRAAAQASAVPEDWLPSILGAGLLAGLLVLLGQLVFRRWQGHFGEEI